MRLNLSNNASTVLQSDISGNDTIITVDSTEMLPEAPFPLTLNMTEEIVYVTKIDGNTLTVERGQEETDSKAYPSGTECWVNFTVGAYDGLSDSIDEVGEELTSHMADYETLKDEFLAMAESSEIVEVGANENGEYVRWANGLQICLGRTRGNIKSNETLLEDIPLPAKFKKVTSSSISGFSVYSTNNNYNNDFNIERNSIIVFGRISEWRVIKYVSLTNSESEGYYQLFSIGWWK